MKNNTISQLLLGTAWQPVWAPEDGSGSGGDSSTGSDTGDGDAGGGASGSGSAGTALDGHVPAGKTPAEGGDGSGDDVKPDDTKTALEGDDTGDNSGDDTGGEGGDADDATSTVPEDGNYAFNVPEGVEISDEQTQYWGGKFAEMKLTQAQADQLVTAQAEQQLEDDKAFVASVEKRETDHLEAAQKDPDIGGDNWNGTLAHVNKAIDQMGGTAIKDLLVQGGHGNNPEVIRELRNIGKLFAEDNFDPKTSDEAAVSTESSWYGKTTPDKKKG